MSMDDVQQYMYDMCMYIVHAHVVHMNNDNPFEVHARTCTCTGMNNLLPCSCIAVFPMQNLVSYKKHE